MNPVFHAVILLGYVCDDGMFKVGLKNFLY